MVEINKLALSSAEPVTEPQIDIDLAFALIALELGLTGEASKAADETKRALDAQLEAAKNVTGGKGYDFVPVVDHGHRTRRGMGSVALTNSAGLAQKPYGMPKMRTRKGFTNPYINRTDVWF